MKIAQLGCRTVRDGITVAIVFAGMGLALMVVAGLPLVELGYFPVVVTGLGLLLLVMGAVILLASLVRSAEAGKAVASSTNRTRTVDRINAT